MTDCLQSTEQVGLTKLPPVLMLRLTRLDEHGQKVTTQVQLDPGLTFTSTEGAKLEYSLYGVVERVSAGREQGHCVAYVQGELTALATVCLRVLLTSLYNHRRSTVRGTRYRRPSSRRSTGNTCALDRHNCSSTVPIAQYRSHSKLRRAIIAVQGRATGLWGRQWVNGGLTPLTLVVSTM
jgi:hypothetical protein